MGILEWRVGEKKKKIRSGAADFQSNLNTHCYTFLFEPTCQSIDY